MQRIRDSITTREQTEAGDIARSLEGLIKSQFIDRDFMSLMASTRLSRLEIEEFSNMNYVRVMSRIMRVTDQDTKDDKTKHLSEYDVQQLKDALTLREAMRKNPWVIHEVESYAWMYMYAIGQQSFDGLSRGEGRDMVTGSTRRLMDKDKMGFWDRLGRRFTGKGIEYSE